MIVIPPRIESAQGHVAAMYQEDLDADGFVSSHTQAMAIDPEAHEQFEALIGAIMPSIGLRTYELATLGAARALGSAHCLLAHGRKTLRAGLLDEDELVAFAVGGDVDGLSEADAAVVRFAERLSTDAAAMTDADSQSLRDHGFSDRQIVDIALAAGVRNLFSRTLQALAVPVDEVPGLSPALADALLTPTRR
ncbi:MAG: carboxymuconolactone decarboxylase family protein [Microbacterium sp.]